MNNILFRALIVNILIYFIIVTSASSDYQIVAESYDNTATLPTNNSISLFSQPITGTVATVIAGLPSRSFISPPNTTLAGLERSICQSNLSGNVIFLNYGVINPTITNLYVTKIAPNGIIIDDVAVPNSLVQQYTDHTGICRSNGKLLLLANLSAGVPMSALIELDPHSGQFNVLASYPLLIYPQTLAYDAVRDIIYFVVQTATGSNKLYGIPLSTTVLNDLATLPGPYYVSRLALEPNSGFLVASVLIPTNYGNGLFDASSVIVSLTPTIAGYQSSLLSLVDYAPFPYSTGSNLVGNLLAYPLAGIYNPAQFAYSLAAIDYSISNSPVTHLERRSYGISGNALSVTIQTTTISQTQLLQQVPIYGTSHNVIDILFIGDF